MPSWKRQPSGYGIGYRVCLPMNLARLTKNWKAPNGSREKPRPTDCGIWEQACCVGRWSYSRRHPADCRRWRPQGQRVSGNVMIWGCPTRAPSFFFIQKIRTPARVFGFFGARGDIGLSEKVRRINDFRHRTKSDLIHIPPECVSNRRDSPTG